MKKKLATLILTSSIVTASLAAPFTASADELTEKIEQQEQIVNELESRVTAAESILANVQAEITAAENRAQELLGQRVSTQDEITVLNEEIARLQEIIEQREKQLREQARSVQINGSNTNYLNFIFASESLSDLFSRIDVVTTMVSANKSLVEQQVSDQQLVEDKRVETEEKLDEIIGMSVELEELKGELAVKQIEQESAVAALNAEKATAEEDRQRFIAQKEEADRLAAEEAARQEEARLAAAEAESNRVAMEEAARVENVSNTETPSIVETIVVETPAPTPAPTPEPSTPSTPTVTEPVNKPDPAPVQPALPSGDLISTAYKYIGVPYVYAGKTPAGFDCSGFTSYVFREAYGMEIGGWTGAQERLGTRISTSQAQPGDLLFWGNPGATYHVAIYLGNQQYIHAPDVGGSVEVRDFSWFNPQFAVRVAR